MDATLLKSNLSAQLEELEALQSMFCNPGEVRVEDPAVQSQIASYIADQSQDIPPFLDLIINVTIDDAKFELCVNLSNDYPQVEPDIYVRNHRLTKKHHAAVNKDMGDYLAGLERGTPCIFSAISWLQDESHKYLCDTNVNNSEVGAVTLTHKTNENLVRFWIYSHHIYSKSKRREIQSQAEALNITGFCMPGKPGIVCVEGRASECAEWWQIIKSMNWKRIFCKVTEECSKFEGSSESNFRKFRTFREMIFQNNNIKCNHMDMGELYKYLDDHQCGYIFKDLFGVEANKS